MLTLAARQLEHVAGDRPLLEGIQRVKGVKLPPSTINRQDNSIQGWSWIADTFSWAEPTAWCLLALKKWRQKSSPGVNAQRVTDAESLLIDRCCARGGWNYGNANMLARSSSLTCRQQRSRCSRCRIARQSPTFVKSRDYLNREAASEQSSVALSLALIALKQLKQPIDALGIGDSPSAEHYDRARQSVRNGTRTLLPPTQARTMAPSRFKHREPGVGLSRRQFLGALSVPLVASACSRRPYDSSLFRVPDRSAVALLNAPNYDVDFADSHWPWLARAGARRARQTCVPQTQHGGVRAGHRHQHTPAGRCWCRNRVPVGGRREVVVGEGPGHRRDTEYLLTSTGLIRSASRAAHTLRRFESG